MLCTCGFVVERVFYIIITTRCQRNILTTMLKYLKKTTMALCEKQGGQALISLTSYLLIQGYGGLKDFVKYLRSPLQYYLSFIHLFLINLKRRVNPNVLFFSTCTSSAPLQLFLHRTASCRASLIRNVVILFKRKGLEPP